MTSITTDSAASRAGKISKTSAYYAAFIALGLMTAVLGPTLPDLAANTGSLLSEISFLFVARSLGYLMGSLFLGRLYDHIPGHRVGVGVLLVVAAMLFVVPLISLLWLLTTILFVLGLAEGTLDLGGNVMLVWVHGKKVGPYMNGLHFFFGVGAFLAPIIVAQAILLTGSITWAYWFLALVTLPVAIWFWRLPSPQREENAEGGYAGSLNTLMVALIAFFFFLYVGAEASFGGWIFTYTLETGLSEAQMAALLTSAFWGALTVGRLLTVPLAARIRPRWLIFGDLLGCVLSLVVILLFPGQLLAIWIGTMGTGLAMASIFPTTITLAERNMTVTGKVTGWFFVGAGAGGMTLPWVIGQLFERVGPTVMMIAILSNIILAVGVFAGILWSIKRAIS
jgi:MFS transporter, FHS family, Na+ dependent glucose transporter 1